MRGLEETVRLLGDMVDSKINPQLRWAEVTKVNWSEKVADVKLVADELELFDVQLGLGSINLKPKVGSKCLILIYEGSDAGGYLLTADKLDGVQFLAQEESMRTIINDLINNVFKPFMDECAKIIVVQGTTINKIEVVKQKQELEKILARFNKVLIDN